MPKKILKTYHGLPKTPIDDNTIFYASLDGTLTPEIGGAVDTTSNNLFKPSITGLGATKNVNGANRLRFNSIMPSLSDSTNALTVDCTLYSTGSKTSAQQFLWILSNINGDGGYLINLRIGTDNKLVITSYADDVATQSSCTDTDVMPLGLVHIRVVIKGGNSFYLYVNGKLKSSKTNGTVYRTIAVPKYMYILSDEPGIRWLDSTLNTMCNITVSNGDLGTNFPTLPQDFIDGYARVVPAPTAQRSIYSDALTSEYKTDIVKIGTNLPQITNSRTSGNWTSGDTIKVKGMAGEIISGVIDSDTALAKIVQDGTNTTTFYVDSTDKFTVNDTIKIYNSSLTYTNGTTYNITAIDTTLKTITIDVSRTVSAGDVIFETTASSSSPLVKANLTGTATAGASSTITLPTGFSVTDDAYNNLDIMITSGTGAGQRRTISDYVGSTKVATVSSSWTTTPDSTSVFVVYKVPVTGTWSNLGTNESTFTLGTNDTIFTTNDIQIEYSLNEVAGQGALGEVLTKTLGGEVNRKKLAVGSTVLIRDDFAGKISGSVIECPHIMKYTGGTSLGSPSSFSTENPQASMSLVSQLDGNVSSTPIITAGNITQRLFSFNLIRMVEDKYGEIPAIDKVSWLKINISKINFYWYGYGICPNGYKASIAPWSSYANMWRTSDSAVTTTSSSVAQLLRGVYDTYAENTPIKAIDPNGFVHFIAYTDSAQAVSSTILPLTNHGLTMYDLVENTTRGNAVSNVGATGVYDYNSNSINTSHVLSGSFSGQTTGDTINKYKLQGSTPACITGTNETTVKMTAHGLSTGDYIKNIARGTTLSKITVVDANTFTCQTTITGQTSGDTFYIYKFSGTQTAEAVSASTIYTDYVNLDVELKVPSGYEALYPENPRRDNSYLLKSSDMLITDDFYRKSAGDTYRVPHTMKYGSQTALQNPISGSLIESTNQSLFYDKVMTLNNDSCYYGYTNTNGGIPQNCFSFNLIRLIEDNYGTIPSADKVAWLKTNLSLITCNLYAYGVCPTGNKIYLKWFRTSDNTWQGTENNTSSYTTLLSNPLGSSISVMIDTNGFVHYLAYTDASDGVTTSGIYVDYVNISVTLKDLAITQLPVLKKKRGIDNAILVRRETKEVLFMFNGTEKDGLVTYGEYTPYLGQGSIITKAKILAVGDPIITTVGTGSPALNTSINTAVASYNAMSSRFPTLLEDYKLSTELFKSDGLDVFMDKLTLKTTHTSATYLGNALRLSLARGLYLYPQSTLSVVPVRGINKRPTIASDVVSNSNGQLILKLSTPTTLPSECIVLVPILVTENSNMYMVVLSTKRSKSIFQEGLFFYSSDITYDIYKLNYRPLIK